jgi:hypothetical protein
MILKYVQSYLAELIQQKIIVEILSWGIKKAAEITQQP